MEVIFSPDRGAYQEVDSLPSPLHRVVLPLVYRRDNQLRVVGTAFVINPFSGLLVSAKHVIEGLFGDLSRYSGDDIGTDLFASCLAGATTENFLGLMAVRQVYCRPDFDVAILRAEVPVPKGEEDPTKSLLSDLPLDFSPPQVGGNCLALGYDSDNQWHQTDDSVKIILSLKSSNGLIQTDLNDERPYPLFRISAEVRDGLSGGPVINENGEVVGIVSSGMILSDGGDPVSWASHSSALLPIRVPIENGEETFFYNLVKNGSIRTNDYFNQIELSVVG